MSPLNHINPPLLVIVGQTATGKSSLAIELARRLNGELICADSWTVRRELDIGTAKPNTAERKLVPHHLLDLVGPDEDFTAAVFKELANQSITDIHARGKLPILVGGTGLYVDGVIYDFGFLAAGDRSLRPELNALSIPELKDRITAHGISYDGIDTQNRRRLIRLLETGGQVPTRQALRTNTFIIGTQVEPTELLSRITNRVDRMLADGLEGEVRDLSKRYGWGCEGLKGIGYREWRDYFEGQQTIEETRHRLITSTCNLAKRQRTWFKRNKSIHWCIAPVNMKVIVDVITATLNK